MLGLPPKELKANNGRPCWQAVARARKAYREEARLCAAAGLIWRSPPGLKRATVRVTYYQNTSRRLDPDNALFALKSAFDGFQDAGLFANDRNLTHLPVEQRTDKNNPRVEIEVEGC